MQSTELNQAEIYSVSRLNNEVRFLLEDAYPFVWVEGEISNFSAPASGHWYFSLKDATAQVRCCMFRGNQRSLNFKPKDGMLILIRARVSMYETRGEFQLIAEHMEERGEGKLRRAYEELRKKLSALGMFDAAHKQSFPLYPRTIGVITSQTGAAIRDILTVLKRRYAIANIIIYPTLVQGETAAPSIVKAIQLANVRNECDVIILARGGGSLEDLWPFNEEIVAHAIFNSKLPIISGVGHEVDFTIADFVADKRAPTPSAAAEMITPDRTDLLQILLRNKQIFLRLAQQTILALQKQMQWMQKHLSQQHPKRRLIEKMQRLDTLAITLTQLQERCFHQAKSQLKLIEVELNKQIPTQRIARLQHSTQLAQQQFVMFMMTKLKQSQATLAHLAASLDALSPLATLRRGYAIASKDEQIIYSTKTIHVGDKIQIRFAEGVLDCNVEEIKQ